MDAIGQLGLSKHRLLCSKKKVLENLQISHQY